MPARDSAVSREPAHPKQRERIGSRHCQSGLSPTSTHSCHIMVPWDEGRLSPWPCPLQSPSGMFFLATVPYQGVSGPMCEAQAQLVSGRQGMEPDTVVSGSCWDEGSRDFLEKHRAELPPKRAECLASREGKKRHYRQRGWHGWSQRRAAEGGE